MFSLDLHLCSFCSECRSKREMPSLYPHARGILYALKEKGIDLAIASRSPTADIAKTFIDKLSIKSMFVAQVIQQSTFLFLGVFPPSDDIFSILLFFINVSIGIKRAGQRHNLVIEFYFLF